MVGKANIYLLELPGTLYKVPHEVLIEYDVLDYILNWNSSIVRPFDSMCGVLKIPAYKM